MSKIPKRKLHRQPLQPSLARIAHVVTRVRQGNSVTRASAEEGVDRRSVIKLAGKALFKTKSGRYRARANDNLARDLLVPVYGGPPEVYWVRGPQAATVLSERLSAQRYFLDTGDDTRIRKLRGTIVRDIYGNDVPFLTDLDELERQGDAGLLSFESMYAHRA
jgi:hypothetical protein